MQDCREALQCSHEISLHGNEQAWHQAECGPYCVNGTNVLCWYCVNATSYCSLPICIHMSDTSQIIHTEQSIHHPTCQTQLSTAMIRAIVHIITSGNAGVDVWRGLSDHTPALAPMESPTCKEAETTLCSRLSVRFTFIPPGIRFIYIDANIE